jgi:predicted small metal-binding protein
MTLSLNCKDAGDPLCTHTMYGETEEELLQNAKKHGIEVHGYTEGFDKEEELNCSLSGVKPFYPILIDNQLCSPNNSYLYG